MKKKSEKREFGGYMTVEACFLVPIALYLCVFILYAGFYQYDKCVIKQDAYRAALRGSSLYRYSNEEIYRAAADTWDDLTRGQLIAARKDVSILAGKKVEVNVTGEIPMPFRGISALLGAGRWRIEERAESKCIDPALFIRTCRGLRGQQGKKRKE